MSTQASLGQKALDSDDYPAAIAHYTSALNESPTSPDYYIKRSVAHQRSGDSTSALRDAEIAVVAATRRGRRELIISAQFRRGIALLTLERYADAKSVFDLVESMGFKDNSLPIYKSKVDGKLKDLPEDDARGKVSIKQVPDVEIPQPEKSTPKPASKAPEAKAAVSAPKTEPVTTIPSRIKHDWYQSNDKVTITLLAKNAPKDKTTISINSDSVSISFPTANDSTFEFSIDPLFDTINASTSSYNITATKIEIVLVKAIPRKWSSLEGAEKPSEKGSIPSAVLSAPSEEPAKKAPNYPTSSKSGPKNWDKVAEDYDDDKDGGDEVTNFFKHLYSGADPDTRRAMIKSYQESNGTVLSTNWKEVGQNKVEVAPPDGMVEKKWEE